jgi:cytochrome c556
MRHFVTYFAAVVFAASVAVAAQSAQTAEDLDKAMKRVGAANGAMNKAIKAMAWADAKKQADEVEAALKEAHGFWVVKKRDDAIKMSAEAQAKLKALGTALAASSPDSTVVAAAAKEFGSTCLSCHKAYREQDANQQFILKPGI